MNDKSSKLDSTELTNSEEQSDFDRFWTEETIRESKILAKKLMKTNLDAIESDGLRVKKKPEQTVLATPATNSSPPTVVYEPEKPELYLSMGSLVEDHIKVFKIKEKGNYPKNEDA